MERMWKLLCLVIFCGILMPTSCIGEDEHIAPVLPTQFAADLHVISHLTDPSQEYPPSMRKLKIQYDFDQKMAKAVVLKGYDAGKTYVRRYDEKKEYMVKSGQYKKCERAYLGEEMPLPDIPHEQEFVGIENVRGTICEHWVHSYANVRVHVYKSMDNSVPIRLTEENIVNDVPTLLLTYDLHNIKLGPQSLKDFDIPGGFSHKECIRNVAGFPYVHAFHYYLRF